MLSFSPPDHTTEGNSIARMEPLDWHTGYRANRPFENIYHRVSAPPNLHTTRNPVKTTIWGAEQAAFFAMEPPAPNQSQLPEPATKAEHPFHNLWGLFGIFVALFFRYGQSLLASSRKLAQWTTLRVVEIGMVLRKPTVWEHVVTIIVALLLVLYVFPSPGGGDLRVMQTVVEVEPQYILMIPYQANMRTS